MKEVLDQISEQFRSLQLGDVADAGEKLEPPIRPLSYRPFGRGGGHDRVFLPMDEEYRTTDSIERLAELAAPHEDAGNRT